jgi:hypothetical protein
VLKHLCCGTAQARVHRDEWDLGRCGAPARLAWTAARAVWAAREGARDARSGAKRAMERLSSGGDDERNQARTLVLAQDGGVCLTRLAALALISSDALQGISVDPTDPTRFFQQEDSFNKVVQVPCIVCKHQLVLHVLLLHDVVARQGRNPGVACMHAQDFFTLATIAALLWLFASAFYELEKIH